MPCVQLKFFLMTGPYIPNFDELFRAAPRGGGGRGLALGLFFSISM